MAARITIDRNAYGEIELLAERGRGAICSCGELQRLGPDNEHFHLGPSGEIPGVPLQTRAYTPAGTSHSAWSKVLFRLDGMGCRAFPACAPDGRSALSSLRTKRARRKCGRLRWSLSSIEFRERESDAVLVVHNFGWDEARRARAGPPQFRWPRQENAGRSGETWKSGCARSYMRRSTQPTGGPSGIGLALTGCRDFRVVRTFPSDWKSL